MTSVFGAYLNCIWKLILNECQDGIRVWSVSEMHLKVGSEWVSEWCSCLGRICIVSESWIWMSVRMASVSGVYLNYIWKLDLNEYHNGIRVWSVSKLYLKVGSEWVSEWHTCLERIWIVSEKLNLNEYQDDIRIGSYLNCSWKVVLNECQNGIRVWSVSELYLRVESEWVS